MPMGIYERKPRKSLSDRFWSKVDKRGVDECWIWMGANNGKGYGRMFHSRDGGYMSAHRVSWELHKGSIPEREGFHGICVLHNCPGADNPACVNINHLRLGTQEENCVDATLKGNNPVSKITADQARNIKASNKGRGDLSREFGISEKQIRRIQNGTRWTSILSEEEKEKARLRIIVPRHRYTDAQIKYILESPDKPKVVAEKLGLDAISISHLRSRHGKNAWKQ